MPDNFPTLETDKVYNIFISHTSIYVDDPKTGKPKYTGRKRTEVMALETIHNENRNPIPYPIQSVEGRACIVLRNQDGNPYHYRYRNVLGAYKAMTGENVEEYYDGSRRGNRNKYFIYIDSEGEFSLVERD